MHKTCYLNDYMSKTTSRHSKMAAKKWTRDTLFPKMNGTPIQNQVAESFLFVNTVDIPMIP